MFSLAGKTALVTGANGYLGRSIVEALLEAGASVYLNGRNVDTVQKLATSLQKKGLSALPAAFDITSDEQVSRFFEEISGVSLDILVNNAYAGATGAVEVTSAEKYRESYEVSVVATHVLVRNALDALRTAKARNGDASVINIASMYGIVSPDLRVYPDKQRANAAFYGASKAALIQWTRYAACEFGPEGIRFNSVAPGAFPSPEAQRTSPELMPQLEGKIPLGRVGVSREIGGVVTFLASPAASYVTGALIPVDGGWTAW